MHYYKFKLHSTKTDTFNFVLGWIPFGINAKTDQEKLIKGDRKIALIHIVIMSVIIIALLMSFQIGFKAYFDYFLGFFDYVFSFSSEKRHEFSELTHTYLNQYNKIAFVIVVYLTFMIVSNLDKIVSFGKSENTSTPIVILLFSALIFVKYMILLFSMYSFSTTLFYIFSFCVGIILTYLVSYFVIRIFLKK